MSDAIESNESVKAEARVWMRDPRSPAKGYAIMQHLLVALESTERTVVMLARKLEERDE